MKNTFSILKRSTIVFAVVAIISTVGVVTAATNNSVRFVQEKLTDLGYSPGPIDGVMGGKTRAAINEFQQNAGNQSTGEVSSKLVDALNAPCQREIINGVGYQRGACRKPKEVAPGIGVMELKPGDAPVRIQMGF